MKTKLTAAVIFVSSFYVLPSALGQGALTPPGAPGPMMKSLDQIEARTPISSVPFTIMQPGSYYLTTNLIVSGGNAITIAANGVTLDLNGFTLSSTEASPTGTGILLNGTLRDITIANGHIQGGVTNNGSGIHNGSGFGYAIFYSGNNPVNVLVSRVSASGCLNSGIFLGVGDSTVVESCTVRTAGGYGIAASTVKQSSAIDCGSYAIYGDQVSDCRGQSGGSGAGIDAFIAQNCYGYSSSGDGVYAYGTAMNCFGSSSGSTGVYSYGTAMNCFGYSYGGGYGVYIQASSALNCYGYSSSGVGVQAKNAQNCSGLSDGNGSGVFADTALNSYGYSSSGAGIDALIAQNCYGYSSIGTGLYAGEIATGCFGYSSSGTAVFAFIASVCHGNTSTGTALSTTHNVNSF